MLWPTGTPVAPDDVARWDEYSPNEHIPVLADSDLLLHTHMDITGIPNLSPLDAGMRFEVLVASGPTDAFRVLAKVPPAN